MLTSTISHLVRTTIESELEEDAVFLGELGVTPSKKVALWCLLKAVLYFLMMAAAFFISDGEDYDLRRCEVGNVKGSTIWYVRWCFSFFLVRYSFVSSLIPFRSPMWPHFTNTHTHTHTHRSLFYNTTSDCHIFDANAEVPEDEECAACTDEGTILGCLVDDGSPDPYVESPSVSFTVHAHAHTHTHE